MTRALLLDLGNVLVRFDHGHTLRRLEAATGVPAEALRPHLFGPLERDFDTGRLTAFEFFRAVESEAGLPRLPDEVWIPAWRDIFEPVPEALGVLGELATDVRTAIVSNTNALHWEGVLGVSHLEDRVHALALSYRVGAVKPDPAIFRAAFEALGGPFDDTLYADDRTELVEAARRLGIPAFVVDHSQALGRELRARGWLRDVFDSPLYARGLEEFRAGRFFEAHEEWERLWTTAGGRERVFLQGLIQLAAGCVHLGKGRREPGLRLLALSLAKLEHSPVEFGGLEVTTIREALRAALNGVEDPGIFLRRFRL